MDEQNLKLVLLRLKLFGTFLQVGKDLLRLGFGALKAGFEAHSTLGYTLRLRFRSQGWVRVVRT